MNQGRGRCLREIARRNLGDLLLKSGLLERTETLGRDGITKRVMDA